MIVYDIATGAPVHCQANPWRNNEYLIPANTTEKKPPAFNANEKAVFNGSSWLVQIIEKDEPTGETPEQFAKRQEDELKDIPIPDVMLMFRAQRNYKLSVCDFRVLPDYSGSDKDAWIAYRAALRDLPGQIEAGQKPKPTLNEEFKLNAYEHWPIEPGSTALFPENF
jgi:hypothetical protein